MNLDLNRYRAQQIFSWLWRNDITDFNEMTNLSKAFREHLAQVYYIGRLKVLSEQHADDGTVKFLLRLEDGESIETVFIPEGDRRTICVSTQVGCPLGCVFCASGQIDFKRNLLAWEIVDQILRIKSCLRMGVTNIVFMGIGEPMLNLTEVFKAILLINSDYALNIGARHITVSTAGIIEGIRAMAKGPSRVKLAISLNATTNVVRNMLMPVNRKYPLEDLLEAVRFYGKTRQIRTTFEYVLIAGVNDRRADARRLVKILKGIPSKINIIPLNEIAGLAFKKPPGEKVLAFIDAMKDNPIPITLRKSKGIEIMAGCGQLRAIYG